MPVRRASASAGHPSSTPNLSSSRLHRSNDSHGFNSMAPHGVPYPSAGLSTTPQQKVVHILVNRLKNKLPVHSGSNICMIEADEGLQEAISTLIGLSNDSADIIGWALAELLDKLAKPSDLHGQRHLDVLQSQLMLLKVLCVVLASRWRERQNEAGPRSGLKGKSPMSSTSAHSLPSSPNSTIRSNQFSYEHLSSLAAASWLEPLPLDDNCAKYILSVMIVYLRQTAAPDAVLLPYDNIDFNTSFHDFETFQYPGMPSPIQADPSFGLGVTPESIGAPRCRVSKSPEDVYVPKSTTPAVTLPQYFTTYEKTSQMLHQSSLSMNLLIAKFVGRILYHLSASNWSAVFSRIKNKIYALAESSEENPDVLDLQLVSHSLIDRAKLVQILQELSSLLVNMKLDAQAAIAGPLRSAIWNWIDTFPDEYHDSLRSRSRLEGAPERVYDLLFNVKDVDKAAVIWPTLTALMCATSVERIGSEFSLSNTGRTIQRSKDRNFVEILTRYAGSSPKFSQIAIVCLLDFARGACRAEVVGEAPSYSADIAHELKTYLLNYHDNKPFWEADEVDVAIISTALATLYRFLPEEDAVSLFKTCVEPEQSPAVKVCVIQACIMLTSERHRLPWQRSLDNLIKVLSHPFRVAHVVAIYASNVSKKGTPGKMRNRPKAKKPTSEIHEDRELVIFSLMTLWRGDLPWHVLAMDVEESEDWVQNAQMVWWAPSERAIKLSTARCFRAITDRVFKLTPESPRFEGAVMWVKLVTPASIVTVSHALLQCRFDFQQQHMWVGIMHGLLDLYTRKAEKVHHEDMQCSEERVAAFALCEIACLVSLTSINPTVSLTAAHCLRMIAESERHHPEVPLNLAFTEDERCKRYPVYDQLGDSNVPVVGRISHQKRIRNLVRLVASSSSPMYVAVWKECYFRCRIFGGSIRNSLDSPSAAPTAGDPDFAQPSLTLEERHAQWHNFALFLAAFGAAVSEENQDPRSLLITIPLKYLPDQMHTMRDSNKLLNEFLEHLIDLLMSDSIVTREVARDALGAELSPRLYNRVFRYLEDVIRDIATTHDSTLKWSENFSIFLDQFIAIIKALVEQVQSPDDLLNVDVMTILVTFANFLSRFTDPACSRIRIKYCTMCDSTLHRLDKLALRRDSSPRQNILDSILDWVQDPKTVVDCEPSQQLEMNLAILRTSVRLMDRLQLQPQEATGEEAHQVVSRLFARYQRIGYKILDYGSAMIDDGGSDVSATSLGSRTTQREAEICDLIIRGSASLISANTEVGIKHTMGSAYDPIMKRRAIFARVFSRVLDAGTRFDGPSSSVSKQSKLCELVKGSDLMLALAICETCPTNEVDFIVPVLLNLFDTRASLMSLLQVVIEREVAQAEAPGDLFRRNTASVRLLSTFARIHGYTYLRGLIMPLVKTMVTMPPGHGYDLDPTRALGQDLKQNQKNVEFVTSTFLEIVTSSLPAIPTMLHEVCAHIGKAVSKVWPESRFAALGAFMFLRFISPAIVAPDVVDIEIPKDDGGLVRRGLMVICKVIQNLANNIFFGKEAHMVSLNKFLEAHIVNVTRFLSELSKYEPSVSEDADEWLGLTYDDTDTIVLHRFFEKHADKVGKELLSLSRPAGDGDASTVSGKRAWDTLCAALVELGSPMAVPQASTIMSDQHQEFKALMSRFAQRDTSLVQNLFVECPVIDDQIATFVYFSSQVEADTVDVELLLFHIFKTIMAPGRPTHSCDVIVDATGFTSSSQLPVQWLKYITELVPADIISRVRTVHLLNFNATAYRYMRRLHNLSAGSFSCLDTKVYSSVAELSEHVHSDTLVPLEDASKLEAEPMESFREVTMRQDQQTKSPVLLDVGTTHIRLTMVKAQPMTSSVSCRCTEIIALADVSDVYNISTGHDPNEFIIRRVRQGAILYFSSPMRDAIIKSIRTAKGSMKSLPLIGPERYSRLSNVIAALLNVGMFSSTYEEEDLRDAGYELITAVCNYLEYEGSCLVPIKGAHVSRQTNSLVVQLSERLALHAPKLTLDLLSEVTITMGKATMQQKIHCLQYISPWIKNLSHFTEPTSSHYDHSGARLRDCVHGLIEMPLADDEVYTMVRHYIWSEVSRLDTAVVNLILDELMRSAVDGGEVGSLRSEMIADTVGTLSSINVRGRILSKLRKVITKTSAKPTKSLADNVHWNEIAALTRLVQVSGAQCRQAVQSQLFVPEIVHLVTLIAATGQTVVRQSVHGIVMNMLQSLTMGKTGESTPISEIGNLLEKCKEPETLLIFGLERSGITGEYSNHDPPTDKLVIANQEKLARFLAQIMETVAGSKGLLNVWRARWMSLVSSTAFQQSPAVQSRAFISLGILATSDVDDDLFYQMLVAFRTALSQSTEADTITVVSMLRCFAKILPALPVTSRFTPQMFWLSVALLQASHMPYFVEATDLLRVTLGKLADQGAFDERGVSATLLDERAPLEEAMVQLDNMFGLSFQSSFSFSLAAGIFKGIRHSALKESAVGVLRSLLRITVACKGDYEETLRTPAGAVYYDALGYFLALLPTSSTRDGFRTLLQDAGVKSSWLSDSESDDDADDTFAPRIPLELLGVDDVRTALLVTSFIGAMLQTSQGDDSETEMLYGILSDIGDKFPDIISMAYDSLQGKLFEAFANVSHPDIIKYVANLFNIAMQSDHIRLTPVRGSASTLSTVDEGGPGRRHISELEALGLQGLPSNFQFIPQNRGHATRVIQWIAELVQKIVE